MSMLQNNKSFPLINCRRLSHGEKIKNPTSTLSRIPLQNGLPHGIAGTYDRK